MVRKHQSRMIVEKSVQSQESGFTTDEFYIETNKTLLKHKMMTFSAKVARQIGYTTGTMTLTLVWEEKRMDVRFVRDSHPGGGWRSVKKDFEQFFEAVGFKENQGYSVYQVPGLGQYAFEFVKTSEYFPEGGTVTVPVVRRGKRAAIPDDAEAKEKEVGETSRAPDGVKKIKWRRSVAARKSTGVSVGPAKQKKPRSQVQYSKKGSSSKEKMVRLVPADDSGKSDRAANDEDLMVLKVLREQEETGGLLQRWMERSSQKAG